MPSVVRSSSSAPAEVSTRTPVGRWVAIRSLGLVVVTGLAAGCQVDVAIDAEVAPDQSGALEVVVTLDEEAAADVPDLADALVVDDLRRDGWEVTVGDGADGGVVVSAEHAFSSLEEAAALTERLTGPDGPLVLRFGRRVAADVTTFTVDGEADLTDGLAVFSDAGLQEVLGGSGLGFDEAQLAERAGRPIEEAVRLRVDADLPGREVGASGPQEVALGTTTALSFRSEVRHDERIAWAALAVAATVGLLGVLGWRRRARGTDPPGM